MPRCLKHLPALLALLAALPLAAAETAATNAPATNAPAAKSDLATIPDASYRPVRITNTVTIAGERVTYTAETGMLPVLKTDGTSRASVFYVAYTRQDTTNAAARPVTFCFNGGPGSASVWLHLGALGPRRAKMNPDGTLPAPPFALVDNEYSVLNASDLVFIDPVATGFSRPAKDGKAGRLFRRHGGFGFRRRIHPALDHAARALALAEISVRRKLRRVSRGGPGGPSARALRHVFERADPGLRRAGFCHHRRRRRQRPAVSAVSCRPTRRRRIFTKNCRRICRRIWTRRWRSRAPLRAANTPPRCRPARTLPAAEREKVVAELARLTGLPARVIEDNHLRVDPGVFRKQLLHDEGLILGAYDARMTGRDGDPAADRTGLRPVVRRRHGAVFRRR